MNYRHQICVMTFMAMALVATKVYAAPPREELQQMVQKLQANPADDALREKIIKQAQQLKPAPAVPEEAIEFEGRAQFAFNSAKAAGDYLAAAREYEKAISIAPWVSGYYSDLCTIYQKADKLEDAKRNCEFSLIGLIDAVQITDIKRRIAGLKYGIEQANLAKQTEEDWLVVPRNRVGPIRLGMTALKLFEVLGKSDETTRWGPEGPPVYKWFASSFSVVVDNDAVIAVWSRSSKLHTKEGVKVGMKSAEVRELLGRPIISDAYYLCYAGMLVNLSGDRITEFFLSSLSGYDQCK